MASKGGRYTDLWQPLQPLQVKGPPSTHYSIQHVQDWDNIMNNKH